VKDFFRTYYASNNAVIVVGGAVKADSVRALVRRMFSDIPRGPAITRTTPPAFTLKDTVIVAEDRVQLPRVYMNWHTVKAFHADDPALELTAYLLTGARNARLTNGLVYEQELATNVNGFNASKRLDGDFALFATARPGKHLNEVKRSIDAQLARLGTEGPTARELEQARNAFEARFLNRLESVNAKSEQLNAYYYFTGSPDGFQAELDRMRAVTAEDIKRVVTTYLRGPRVMLSIVPMGKKDLAATREAVQ
jgi:zinc protease